MGLATAEAFFGFSAEAAVAITCLTCVVYIAALLLLRPFDSPFDLFGEARKHFYVSLLLT